MDLLKRYQHTVNIYPPINPAACLAGKHSHILKSTKCLQIYQIYQTSIVLNAVDISGPLGPRLDPLLVATRLLTDSLSRLRVFLSGLDSMGWVTGRDKVTLYNTNICGLAILKASVGLDLAGCPVAYPLPYGEYLGETEALHLITAHDLYNQLRNLISSVQVNFISSVKVNFISSVQVNLFYFYYWRSVIKCCNTSVIVIGAPS